MFCYAGKETQTLFPPYPIIKRVQGQFCVLNKVLPFKVINRAPADSLGSRFAVDWGSPRSLPQLSALVHPQLPWAQGTVNTANPSHR